MGSPGGLAGEGTFEQQGNLLIGNAAGPSRPQLIVQTRHALFEKTLSPLAHRGLGPSQTLSNLGIALARGRPQHYFRAADQRMRQGARSRETLQLCVFVQGQFQGRFGASGEHRAAYRSIHNIASYLWDTTLARLDTVTATRFKSSYSPKRFQSPMVLIHEHEDLTAKSFLSGYYTYKHKIMGFCAPKSDAGEIEKIASWLKIAKRQIGRAHV